MQIHDLVTPIDKLTDEQLLERVREMRHRRERARPVAKQKVERAEKKAVQAKSTKLDRDLATMSPDELAKLVALLGG